MIESLEAGGAQRQLVGLALSFKDRGHQVEFLTYHHIPFYLSVISDAGIPYVTVSTKNYIRRIWAMRNHIRTGKYDVVLSFLETPSFICELATLPFKRWKLIVGERNADPKILTSVRSRAFRFFHVFADKVVSNSYSNLKMVRRVNPFLSKDKCNVIYNMIDFDKWMPNFNRVQAEEHISLIVIGRHVRQKNLMGLIEAVNKLPKFAQDRIRINWYGDKISPPYYDDTYPDALRKIDSYNLNSIFKFFPATPNIVEKIRDADVVSLFSVFEGFPNVICEGMACAKPVIAAAVSDIPLIITDSSMTFDPNNTDDIVRVLMHIVNITTAELKAKGFQNRQLALVNFNPEKIVNEYMALMTG